MKSSKFISLHVFDGSDKVGTITAEPREGTAAFAYDPMWLAREDAYAISPHIPMNSVAASSATVACFIANLLPEGRALDAAASLYRIAQGDVVGLIGKLGWETAGALTFSTIDAPSTRAETEYRRISDDELSERIRGNSATHFAIWHKRFWASLSGREDKLQIRMDGGTFLLADSPICSTHILKPEHQRAIGAHLVANEHYCMSLAKALGLGVAQVAIRRVPEPVLVVERFDRYVERGMTHRRHIIDGCQALNLPPNFKYERMIVDETEPAQQRTGVSLSGLLSNAVKSESARWKLVSWALFNFLIGNDDAHGKNVSFFVSNEGLMPAPFYDMLSIAVYGGDTANGMAMAFGDQFDPALLTTRDMRALAQQAGFTAQAVALEMALLSRKAVELAPELTETTEYESTERSLIRDIASLVASRARRLEAMSDELMGYGQNR